MDQHGLVQTILQAQVQTDPLWLLGLTLRQGDKCPVASSSQNSPTGCSIPSTNAAALAKGNVVSIGLEVVRLNSWDWAMMYQHKAEQLHSERDPAQVERGL